MVTHQTRHNLWESKKSPSIGLSQILREFCLNLSLRRLLHLHPEGKFIQSLARIIMQGNCNGGLSIKAPHRAPSKEHKPLPKSHPPKAKRNQPKPSDHNENRASRPQLNKRIHITNTLKNPPSIHRNHLGDFRSIRSYQGKYGPLTPKFAYTIKRLVSRSYRPYPPIRTTAFRNAPRLIESRSEETNAVYPRVKVCVTQSRFREQFSSGPSSTHG